MYAPDVSDQSEESIYGWTEDFPPRFDEDPDVSLDPTALPLQVYKAAVLFDRFTAT
jgi:hypothetical protein